MLNRRKSPKYDLKNSYAVFLEAGLIVALLCMIVAVKINLVDEPPSPPPVDEQEVVQMEEVVQTQQLETPPPPPRPQIPVEVPNDEIVEDQIIDLDAELDLDGPMDLPPPPPEEDDEEHIFVVVEKYPEPVGGMGSIYNKIDYPEIARRAGIEGRVQLRFLVTKEGEVQEVEVMRSLHPLCDEEAVNAVKSTKFKPGNQRGRPVPVRFSMSISFKLEN